MSLLEINFGLIFILLWQDKKQFKCKMQISKCKMKEKKCEKNFYILHFHFVRQLAD